MDLADVAHFHDWYMIGYRVECAARRLVLQLAWYPETPQARRLDVLFEEVVGHVIENVLEGNIVSSLDEFTPRETVIARAAVFERFRPHGFPDVQAKWKSSDELIAILEARQVKSFEFSSSYGAWGFVLAGTMSIVPVEA